MWLFKLFKKSKYSNELEKPEVQAEALARSIEVRQNEAVLRRLRHELKVQEQRVQIEEAKSYLNALRGTDEPESSGGIEDKLLEVLLTKVLGGNSQNQQPGLAEFLNKGQSPPNEINLTDDEIRNTLKDVPKHYLKMAKKMNDEQLKNVIKTQGNFSDDTLKRALNILRNEKL